MYKISITARMLHYYYKHILVIILLPGIQAPEMWCCFSFDQSLSRPRRQLSRVETETFGLSTKTRPWTGLETETSQSWAHPCMARTYA